MKSPGRMARRAHSSFQMIHLHKTNFYPPPSCLSATIISLTPWSPPFIFIPPPEWKDWTRQSSSWSVCVCVGVSGLVWQPSVREFMSSQWSQPDWAWTLLSLSPPSSRATAPVAWEAPCKHNEGGCSIQQLQKHVTIEKRQLLSGPEEWQARGWTHKINVASGCCWWCR